MSDCSQNADIAPIHALLSGSHDGGEGVAVPHGAEGGVYQRGELLVTWSCVEGQHGVGLAQVDLVRAGCPGTPFFLSIATCLAENLTIHHLNWERERGREREEEGRVKEIARRERNRE